MRFAVGTTSQLILRLSDALLDLDHPVEVSVNGEVRFAGTVERTVDAMWQSLCERADPRSMASTTVSVSW